MSDQNGIEIIFFKKKKKTLLFHTKTNLLMGERDRDRERERLLGGLRLRLRLRRRRPRRSTACLGERERGERGERGERERERRRGLWLRERDRCVLCVWMCCGDECVCVCGRE